MEQTEFLEKNVFTDLKNLNTDEDREDLHIFSATDFEKLLDRVAHYGIGIYTIEAWLNGVSQEVAHQEESKKKATDAKWYRRAFTNLKAQNADFTYSGTYKVSARLLAR
jgi:hypothetical protein